MKAEEFKNKQEEIAKDEEDLVKLKKDLNILNNKVKECQDLLEIFQGKLSMMK